MTYKNIPSALHNFAHSFVSLMNYYDGEYVVDILENLARIAPNHEIRINFSNGKVEPEDVLDNQRLNGSMKHWQGWLPKLLESQEVNPASLQDVLFRYRLTRDGSEVIIEAQDDHGKQHKIFIH